MKDKMYNNVTVQGWLYSAKLTEKVSGATSKNPGTPFINGEVSIATDSNYINVVTVHFSYITPTYTKSGNPNPNYNVLKGIVDGTIGTVMGAEKIAPAIVKVDGSMGLNDFFTTDKQTGEDVAVAQKRIEASFIKVIGMNELPEDEDARATFDFDFLMNGIQLKEANEERNLPEKLIIKGAVFDFRKAILPIELSVLNPGAISYFEGLEPSSRNPVCTRVKGSVISQTVTREIKEEGAWSSSVRTVTSTNKDYVITWAQLDVYPDDVITGEDIEKAMQDREVHLAEVKRNQDEYKASKAAAPSAFATTAAAAPKVREYNF